VEREKRLKNAQRLAHMYMYVQQPRREKSRASGRLPLSGGLEKIAILPSQTGDAKQQEDVTREERKGDDWR
jgi:hypothetical protein